MCVSMLIIAHTITNMKILIKTDYKNIHFYDYNIIITNKKFEFGLRKESLPNCIPQRELTSTLGSPMTTLPTTLLKPGLGPLFLSKGPPMEVLSSWAALIHWEPAGSI